MQVTWGSQEQAPGIGEFSDCYTCCFGAVWSERDKSLYFRHFVKVEMSQFSSFPQTRTVLQSERSYDSMEWAFPLHNEVSSKDIQRARRIALRTRSSAACAKCRETKTKCNDYRPCARCKRNGETCEPVNAEVLNHIGRLITLMCIVLLLVCHRSIEHQVINLQLVPVRVLVKAKSQYNLQIRWNPLTLVIQSD